MTNTIILKDKLVAETIMHLDNNAVITPWANRKYQGVLTSDSQTVTVQSFNRFRSQRATVAGEDITTRDWAFQSFDLKVDQIANDSFKIKNIEELRTNISVRGEITSNIGYAISQTHERHIGKTIAEKVIAASALNIGAPNAISAANVHAAIEALRVLMSQNNAFNDAAIFTDPQTTSFIRQADILDGFAEGLKKRIDGWVPGGNGLLGKISKFTIYETNNLPFRVDLTVDTQVTATDDMTLTFFDEEAEANTAILWTFVAAGAAAVAGDIALGATLAATQQNIIDAIGGTGTPGAATYIDVTAAERALLDNLEIILSAFTADVAFLTTNNSQFTVSVAETFTAGTNVFGTPATVMLACDREAVNFVDQLTEMKVNPASSNAGFFSLIQYESNFKADVLGRNNKRIATMDIVR